MAKVWPRLRVVREKLWVPVTRRAASSVKTSFPIVLPDIYRDFKHVGEPRIEVCRRRERLRRSTAYRRCLSPDVCVSCSNLNGRNVREERKRERVRFGSLNESREQKVCTAEWNVREEFLYLNIPSEALTESVPPTKVISTPRSTLKVKERRRRRAPHLIHQRGINRKTDQKQNEPPRRAYISFLLRVSPSCVSVLNPFHSRVFPPWKGSSFVSSLPSSTRW